MTSRNGSPLSLSFAPMSSPGSPMAAASSLVGGPASTSSTPSSSTRAPPLVVNAPSTPSSALPSASHSRAASVRSSRSASKASSRKGSAKGKKKKKKPIVEDLKIVRDLTQWCEQGSIDPIRQFFGNALNEGRVDVHSGAAGDLLTAAAAHGQVEVMEYLYTVKSNIEYGSGRPLQRACLFGQLEAARSLMARGADVNSKAAFHELTPLMLACQAGHLAIVKALLQGGARMELANHADRNGVNNGWTALHYAADNGFTSIVQLLIQAGCPLDTLTASGDTALAIAAEHGRWDAARLLVQAGAFINAKRRGLNVVQWAIYRADVEAIQFLVSFGGIADLSVRTKWLPGSLTLGELIYREFSEAIYDQIDLAIYRGNNQVLEREKKRKLLSEVTWQHIPVVDPYSFEPPPPPVNRSLPSHIINIICEYEM